VGCQASKRLWLLLKERKSLRTVKRSHSDGRIPGIIVSLFTEVFGGNRESFQELRLCEQLLAAPGS
jgi:hypothetical protein